MFKLSERFLAAGFSAEKRESLLGLCAGTSWHDVSWTDHKDTDGVSNTFNIFVPKVSLHPVRSACDNLSFEEIQGLEALVHPVI